MFVSKLSFVLPTNSCLRREFLSATPSPSPSPQVKLRSAVAGLAYEILEFVHALCVYIELWMHAGSLETTKDA